MVAYAGENRSRALETRRTAGKQGSLFVLFRAVVIKGLYGAFITKKDHGLKDKFGIFNVEHIWFV